MLRTYVELPVRDLARYWVEASNGINPLPWRTPPMIDIPGIGRYDIRAMFITTVSSHAYNLLSYEEFYRIMYRGGYLRYVHPNGREEIILKVHGTYLHPLAQNFDNVIPLFPGNAKD
jgi:hypothetical protein